MNLAQTNQPLPSRSALLQDIIAWHMAGELSGGTAWYGYEVRHNGARRLYKIPVLGKGSERPAARS